jgi:hypothetical protein
MPFVAIYKSFAKLKPYAPAHNMHVQQQQSSFAKATYVYIPFCYSDG